MGRWEPGASSRLREAAMELFVEQGYDGTTVADIAARAGVTGRTFFRHYADKREVLFEGSEEFAAHVVAALATAPADASPLRAVAAAVGAVGEVLQDPGWSALRYRVIASHPELRERELIKMASLAHSLAAGLRERGAAGPEADLAAETGVAVFRVAFERWVEGAPGALRDLVEEAFAQLRGLAAD